MTTSILIADDHPLIRKGLRQTLEETGSFTIVAEVERGDDALRAITELRPQVAILDIQMPGKNGFEIVSFIQEQRVPTEIIILTMHEAEDIFNRAMDLGVKGFVLKENSVRDIVDCVRSVMAGKHYISPRVSDYLVSRRKASQELRQEYPALECLTPTERAVLRLVGDQKTSKEIADLLHISERTIENHRMNIGNKLNIHGNNALLKFAVKHRSQLH